MSHWWPYTRRAQHPIVGSKWSQRRSIDQLLTAFYRVLILLNWLHPPSRQVTWSFSYVTHCTRPRCTDTLHPQHKIIVIRHRWAGLNHFTLQSATLLISWRAVNVSWTLFVCSNLEGIRGLETHTYRLQIYCMLECWILWSIWWVKRGPELSVHIPYTHWMCRYNRCN